MKKMILWSLVCLLGAAAPTALSAGENAPDAKQEKKQAEQTEKQLLFEQALQALQNKDFVLETDWLEYANGRTDRVLANNNFVLMNGAEGQMQFHYSGMEKALQKVSFGLAITGEILGLKTKTKKNGDVVLTYDIIGRGLSSSVVLTLAYGTNRATATISATHANARVTCQGTLWPRELSSVYKAQFGFTP